MSDSYDMRINNLEHTLMELKERVEIIEALLVEIKAAALNPPPEAPAANVSHWPGPSIFDRVAKRP